MPLDAPTGQRSLSPELAAMMDRFASEVLGPDDAAHADRAVDVPDPNEPVAFKAVNASETVLVPRWWLAEGVGRTAVEEAGEHEFTTKAAGSVAPAYHDPLERYLNEVAVEVGAVLPLYISKTASDDEKKAQQERAAKYHIAAKSDGHVTPPANYPDDPDLYLDPTNFKYPCDSPDRTRAAASYWGQKDNRTEYSEAEQKIMDSRLDAFRKKYKIGDYAEKGADLPEAGQKAPPTRPEQPGGPAGKAIFNGPEPPRGEPVVTLKDDGRPGRAQIKLVEQGDDPLAWADPDAERFPLDTPVAVTKSIGEIAKAADLADEDKDRFLARALSAQQRHTLLDAETRLNAPPAEPDPVGHKDVFDDDEAAEMPGDEDDAQLTYRAALLFQSFLSAWQGLDNLNDAVGSDGPDLAQCNALIDQMAAGLKAVFASYYGAGDAAAEKSVGLIVKSAAPQLHELAQSLDPATLGFIAKAGRRHSNTDMKHLADIHAAAGSIQEKAAALGYEPGDSNKADDAKPGSGSKSVNVGPFSLQNGDTLDLPITGDAPDPGSNLESPILASIKSVLAAELEGVKAQVAASGSEVTGLKEQWQRFEETLEERQDEITELREQLSGQKATPNAPLPVADPRWQPPSQRLVPGAPPKGEQTGPGFSRPNAVIPPGLEKLPERIVTPYEEKR